MRDLYEISSNDLLWGYSHGIFPMAKSARDEEVTWLSPESRGVLPLNNLHISRSLKRKVLSKKYKSTFNQNFEEILFHCKNRPETWINTKLTSSYLELHKRKFAHSTEIWYDGDLIGGLFGITIGACFFAESMFSLKADGSKLALVAVVNHLKECGFKLFDVQFHTPHLGSMGVIEIEKSEYEKILTSLVARKVDFFPTNKKPDYLFIP